MIILIPFFGDRPRFRPVLNEWITAYQFSGCKIPWKVLSDQPALPDLPSVQVSIEQFSGVIRPKQAFDTKGALVCAGILAYTEAVLVLDADAYLMKDPTALLKTFNNCAIAMPLDGGALMHQRTANLSQPFSDVWKLCAGVQYFPPMYRSDRQTLVDRYTSAFWKILNVKPGLPWNPPLRHLVEQYAWSVAAHNAKGRVLPHSMNWQPQFLGESADAIVNHHYGFGKWSTFA